MTLSTATRMDPWANTTQGSVQLFASSAVVWAMAAVLLYIVVPGIDTLPRLLVFSECVGLTMMACVVLLRRQARLGQLAAGWRWLLTGAIAIPAGYLLGHQIAFLLLGEPLRVVGFHQVSLIPLLFTVLIGGLGLRHFVVREHLAQEAAARAQAQRLAVEAQLRLLRTQLEPHMLFNTLANLRGLVREDVDRAETMIDRLIAYLRATLAASQTESVPMSREFAQLRAYLEIMSLRMGPRLAWRLDLPAALEATPVPPMLLQPLVENAIKHGLEPKIGPGCIEVVVRPVPAGVEIRIEDDGLGQQPQDPDTSGYGLRHVRERLQAVYGATARLALEHRQPTGTRAVVLLPAIPAAQEPR